jgi:hypothetical protein
LIGVAVVIVCGVLVTAAVNDDTKEVSNKTNVIRAKTMLAIFFLPNVCSCIVNYLCFHICELHY